MPREVVERLSGGVFDSDLVVDSNGDVKSGADYSDGFGNTIDQPDEPEATFVLPVLKPEGSAEEPDELTPLEKAQLDWDNRFDEFDDNAPSTDIARARMINKYGPRPESLEAVSGAAVLADRTLARKMVEGFKDANLQRRLTEIDADATLRPDQKESEKILAIARHKAREDIRNRELGR